MRVLIRSEMDWRRVLRAGPVAMIGSSLAAKSSAYLDGRLLIAGFGFATGWMAYQVLFKTENNRRVFAKIWDFIMGFFAGITSGFTGVSTAVVLLPYLHRIRELELARIVPTSIGVIALSSLASAFTFYFEQSKAESSKVLFTLPTVIVLAIAAILTSQIGLKFQSKVPQRIKLAVVGTVLISFTIGAFIRVADL
jgi:uncharacterized membrane protein YfcA